MATNWKLLLNEMWDDQIIKCYWTFRVSQLFTLSLPLLLVPFCVLSRSFAYSVLIFAVSRSFPCAWAAGRCCLFILICTQNHLNLCEPVSTNVQREQETATLYSICSFHKNINRDGKRSGICAMCARMPDGPARETVKCNNNICIQNWLQSEINSSRWPIFKWPTELAEPLEYGEISGCIPRILVIDIDFDGIRCERVSISKKCYRFL